MRDFHRSGKTINGRTPKIADKIARREQEEELRVTGKLIFAAVVFLCILVFFIYEAFSQQNDFNQFAESRSLEQLINHYGRNDRVLLPNRGMIVDRNMQVMAVSAITYDVVLDIRMLDRRVHPIFLASAQMALEQVFGITNAEFNAFLARNAYGNLVNDTHHLIIQRNLPHSKIEYFHNWVEENREFRLPNANGFYRNLVIIDIHFMEESRRSYPHNTLAAPIIGFQRGAWWGLERFYNDFLLGRPGRTLTTMGADGISTERVAPEHGNTIITTLDLGLQRIAENEASRSAREFEAGFASVIIMNPNTGEILAMAQYPGFCANAPADLGRITSPDFAYYLSLYEPDSPEFFSALFGIWENLNVQVSIEPGSVFKTNVIAMALEEGLISRDKMFYCRGFLDFPGGYSIPCASQWGHGSINLTQALAFSCNVAIMEIAEIVARHEFIRYQRDFGFGARTGIDLPGESAGRLFSVADLNALELATSAFGQRFEATPLQMIASYAPIINGGDLMQPFIVSQIVDSSGAIVLENRPTVVRRVLSRETSDFLRNAMEYVVTIGTGRSAAVPGHAVAGKTATAEQGIQDTAGFSWSLSFIGYFPIENPQFLIQTLIYQISDEVYEARGPGNRSAAPAFARVVEEIIRLHNIHPTREVAGAVHFSPQLFMSDFIGMSISDAVVALNAAGLSFDFIGTAGDIISTQFPAPGSRITENTAILMTIEATGHADLAIVPHVEGIGAELAREALLQADFAPMLVHDNPALDNPAPIVRKQLPRAGLHLPRGTNIILRVAD